jgi:hypothetical protein
MQLLNFFSGKKTYIVGLLMVILGYLQDDQQMILNGIGFIMLRLGISKTNKN